MLTRSNVRLSNLLISSCYYYYLQEIRSVELGVCPMQLFIFDHVTFIQFKICCCVQQFHENPMIFAEIWRYNDIQNGGCPPSGNCFATIRDHPRSLCRWPQLLVKFHVNLIHRSEEWYSYLNFSHIWLEMLIRAPKMGVFGGLWTPKCDYSSSGPQKAHLCVNPRLLSYQL